MKSKWPTTVIVSSVLYRKQNKALFWRCLSAFINLRETVNCNNKPFREKGIILHINMYYLYILYDCGRINENMFNDLIDERKVMSVPCSHEFKRGVLIQREKLLNNIIISF